MDQDYSCEDYVDPVKKKLERAMRWVLGYVVAASAVCTVAMAADAVKVFRHKKLWIPCQYFSLNATSLTLLAIATKLTMDLNVHVGDDMLAKFIGIVFLSTAMANSMSSLGSHEDKDIRINVVAVAILVITMTVDSLLQIDALFANGLSTPYFYAILYTVFSLLQLATVVSLAAAAPAMKRRLESMYEEKHEAALRGEEGLGRMERLTSERMMKYWVMAESSSPQFVMARSVVCTNSALLCLLSDVTLLTVTVIYRSPIDFLEYREPLITSIFYIQSAGILVGSIAPVLRWLVVVTFKCSKDYSTIPSSTKELRSGISFKNNGFFNIESYWTQTLVDWRDSVPVWEIWDYPKLRKYYLRIPMRFVLTICIGLQVLTVRLSNLFIVLSALFMTPFFLCYTRIKKVVNKYFTNNNKQDEIDPNVEQHVLLLDGEVELPRGILRDICGRAKNTIETGRNNQPRHLIELLEKFIDFKGVETGTVDDGILDIPNCWTLPVFTLTCIALALPSSGNGENRKQLLSGAREGLSLARLVDDVQNARLVNVRKAAERFPEIGFDFERHSHFRSSNKVVAALCSEAEDVVRKFKESPSSENPLNWPAKVVVANSMYGITRMILSWPQAEEDYERLLEQISAMIADALAAALTNLPLVITTMCHRSAIEKREKSVRKAFLLLGKTERIVQLVQKKRLSLCYDEAASMEVKFWRPLFQQRTNGATASSPDGSPISTEH